MQSGTPQPSKKSPSRIIIGKYIIDTDKNKTLHGSYGDVYPAEDSSDPTGKPVIIKTTGDLFFNDPFAQKILREIRLLRLLRHHPRVPQLTDIIVKSHETMENYHNISMVFKKMDIDFFRVFQSEQIFGLVHIQYFLLQILDVINYLHSIGIVHRDLKPANILVNANCDLVICDFNLARMISDPTGIARIYLKKKPDSNPIPTAPPEPLRRDLTKHVVTRYYRAPEVVMESEYDFAVDMWSIGCILAELLGMSQKSREKRTPLFQGDACYPLSHDTLPPNGQLDKITDVLGCPTVSDLASIRPNDKIRSHLEEKQKPPQNLSAVFDQLTTDSEGLTSLKISQPKKLELIDLLKQLLTIDPKKRITAKKALAHPFLQDVRHLVQSIPFPPAYFLNSDYELLAECYEFEIKLANEKANGGTIDMSTCRRLIWEEMKKYHVASPSKNPTSTFTAESKSALPVTSMKEQRISVFYSLQQKLFAYSKTNQKVNLEQYKKLVLQAKAANVVNQKMGQNEETALYVALMHGHFDRAKILLVDGLADPHLETAKKDSVVKLIPRLSGKELLEITALLEKKPVSAVPTQHCSVD